MNILTYKGYQGSYEYDPEANIFHGDVLHIHDVVTFQGRTLRHSANTRWRCCKQ